jgi:hypothetical protein
MFPKFILSSRNKLKTEIALFNKTTEAFVLPDQAMLWEISSTELYRSKDTAHSSWVE